MQSRTVVKNPRAERDVLRSLVRRRDGVVLLAVLGVLALLSMLGATLAMLDLRATATTTTFKRSQEALYAADSGCHLVRAFIERDIAAGTLALTGDAEAVTYPSPAGFSFATVTQLTRVAGDDIYAFCVTGSVGSCRSGIRVTFRPECLLEYGCFGDSDVDMGADSGVFVYDSDLELNPTRAGSLGGALTGSNGRFLTHQNVVIDGDLLLGEDTTGTTGEWDETPAGSATVRGDAGLEVGRGEPDPLGAVGGALADEFVFYSAPANNQNATATPPIPASLSISLGNAQSLVLRSGNYYINSLILNNGATLTIMADAGPVNIYLTGTMNAGPGSTVNSPGSPGDLHIYCNSAGPVILKQNGNWNGLLYAPFADVQVFNSGDFRGAIWGNDITIKNGGNMFVDRALQRQFRSGKVMLLAWRELRN